MFRTFGYKPDSNPRPTILQRRLSKPKHRCDGADAMRSSNSLNAAVGRCLPINSFVFERDRRNSNKMSSSVVLLDQGVTIGIYFEDGIVIVLDSSLSTELDL
ncbi:hypothetical protein DY000_02062142 [Brassica cretica]|uniref:Uncharacterized protein n=1 Tax=Brassica cretica TaxID=69181 RepID=A0ABQ7AZ94_BRACR|nr:hypothetical protein DY000_02062142 [Brassica cretica]